MKEPFFILGSPRSGTTLLRNLLRMHPNLICPEETHMFRWSDPFDSQGYEQAEFKLETLQYHRSLDGIGEDEFLDAYQSSANRKELLLNYFKLFAAKHENPDIRVFEKTPQNVYGMLLLHSYFPDAKFIHLIRNPLNVVTSLVLGRQMGKQSLLSAINFWQEAVSMVHAFKKLRADLVFELRYEDLTSSPENCLADILAFLGEEPAAKPIRTDNIHPEQNLYKNTLDDNDLKFIRQQLKYLMQAYGYK